MTWQTHSVLASPSLPEMAWTYAYFNHMVHTQFGALSWRIMVYCMHWIHDPVSNQMNDTFGPCMSMCWWHPAHHTKVQEANAGVSRYLGLSFSHEFTAQGDGLPILVGLTKNESERRLFDREPHFCLIVFNGVFFRVFDFSSAKKNHTWQREIQ